MEHGVDGGKIERLKGALKISWFKRESIGVEIVGEGIHEVCGASVEERLWRSRGKGMIGKEKMRKVERLGGKRGDIDHV